MFRAVRSSSAGAPTVFSASGLHTHVVTAHSQVWVGTVPTQTWLRAVTTCVCKPEAANTVGAPDDERRTARNMLSFQWTSGIINSVTRLHLVGYLYWVTQFILSGNHSTCFGWYHHQSSGVQTTVSTASGICHTIIVICHCHGRVGAGLSVLWVMYATYSTLKPVADNNNDVTNTRCCRYSCLRSWRWVMVPPETCRAVSR